MFGLSRQQCPQFSPLIGTWNQRVMEWLRLRGLLSRGSLLCVSLCPLNLILSLGTHWKEPGSIFAPSLPIFMGINKIPLQLSFSRQTSPSSGRDAPDLFSSLWPFAGLSPLCPCVSCTEEPRTGNRTSGVVLEVLSRGKDHLPHLIIHLMQLRIPLAAFAAKSSSSSWCPPAPSGHFPPGTFQRAFS